MNYDVYGVRKVYAEPKPQGIRVARCSVELLMRAKDLRGIARSKNPPSAAADTIGPRTWSIEGSPRRTGPTVGQHGRLRH